MLNFRYHVVSLVAVFLALTIGIIMGTTVIDQALVKDLRRQRVTDQQTKADLRADVELRDDQLRLWDAFGDSLIPSLMAGRLRGRNVIVVADAGADADLIGGIAAAIERANGVVAGRLAFTDKWALISDTAREQLAVASGVSNRESAELVQAAGGAIATRLRAPRAIGDDDVLRALQRAEFLTIAGVGSGVFPPANAAMVVVAAGGAEPLPSYDDLFVPFLRGAAGGMPTAVAEPLAVKESLAQRVRGDDGLRAVVASIDHANTAPGELALVSALQDVIARRPATHFGVDEGADAVAPRIALRAASSARATPRP
ncbi:MAG TPA: copper transporter [Actinomycetota bacterium]|nr:copper transporter [Actinomycetota bacterium]